MFDSQDYSRMFDIIQRAMTQYWSASLAIRNYETDTAKKKQYEGFFNNVDSFIEDKLFTSLENLINNDISAGGTHTINYSTSNGKLLMKINSSIFCGSKGVTSKLISNMKGSVPDGLWIDGKSAYEVLQTSVDIIKNFGEKPINDLLYHIYNIYPFTYKGMENLIEHFIEDYDDLEIKIMMVDDLIACFYIVGTEKEQLALSKLLALNEKTNIEFKEGKIYVSGCKDSVSSFKFCFTSSKDSKADTYNLNRMDIILYDDEKNYTFSTAIPEKLWEKFMNVFMEKSGYAFKKKFKEAIEKQSLARKKAMTK